MAVRALLGRQRAPDSGEASPPRQTPATRFIGLFFRKIPPFPPERLPADWQPGALGWRRLAVDVSQPGALGCLFMVLAVLPAYLATIICIALVVKVFMAGPLAHRALMGVLALPVLVLGWAISAWLISAVERARARLIQTSSAVLDKAAERQQALDERGGLLSPAVAPQDEDPATLLRPHREEEQAPETLLRRVRPPA
jgi:hypothetical protein